jgi:hypothetical protein
MESFVLDKNSITAIVLMSVTVVLGLGRFVSNHKAKANRLKTA